MWNKIKKIDWKKISLYISITALLFYIIVLFCNIFFDNIVSFYINNKYIFAISMIALTFYFLQIINNIPKNKREKQKLIKVFSYLFLSTLFVIAINQFLKNSLIIKYLFEISCFSIIFGFLIFYANREQVEKKIEIEKRKEKSEEKKRYNKFHKKFSKINKVPVLKLFMLWIYKEGYSYILGLTIIILVGFFLRIWNLDYLQGTDNFNLLSAKSFADNNYFIYNRNLHITYFLGFLFKSFGVNFFVAKISFVIIGTISIFLLYILGSIINKKVGLLSSLLLAISPVAIEKSSIVREYSEILMLSIITIYILLKIFNKYKNLPELFIKKYLIYASIATIFILFYSHFTNSGGYKSILSIIFFVSIPVFYYFIKNHYEKFIIYYVLFISIILILFIKLIHIPITIFHSNFVYNPYWYKMFFDPNIQTPMQWFSFSKFSPILIISIFLITLLVKNQKIFIFQFGFWSIVLLFIFKFYSTFGYNHSRYLYYIYPFYVILFSLSIYSINILLKILKINKIIYLLFLVLLLSNIIIPKNTIHAAIHDLSIWKEIKDKRQPTSYGNRNSFLNVINLLKKNGLSGKEAIVIQGEGNIFLTWYFNYPITRTYKNMRGYEYETGNKIYLVDTSYGINEFEFALDKYSSGYLLWHSSVYRKNDFKYKNKYFKYLGTSEGYKLFKWN